MADSEAAPHMQIQISATTRRRSCATCSTRLSRAAESPAPSDSGAPSPSASLDVRQGLAPRCWYRFFTEAVHGEGFADEQTPELAIVDGHRGTRVGTALMEAVHVRARDQRVTRISLSVDHDNPAKRLYERLGYVEFPPGHEDGRMLLELA